MTEDEMKAAVAAMKQSGRDCFESLEDALTKASAIPKGSILAAEELVKTAAWSFLRHAEREVFRLALCKQSGMSAETYKLIFKQAEGLRRGLEEAESGKPKLNEYGCEPDAYEVMIADFNERFALARTNNDIAILNTDVADTERPLIWNETKLGLDTRPEKLKVGEDGERVSCAQLWLADPGRRVYASIGFEPDERKLKPRAFNWFRGFPTIHGSVGSWSMLRDVLGEQICRGSQGRFDFMMDWTAQMLQDPGNKPGSAVVVKGRKGIGKSTFFDYLRVICGPYGVKFSKPSELVGDFNDHQFGLTFIQCEEAVWAGSKEAESVVKDLITSETMLVHPKFAGRFTAGQYARLAFISNAGWVVPAGLEDERRFFVTECLPTLRGNKSYWLALRKQMDKDGGLAAMRKELFERRLSEDGLAMLREPPDTEELKAQGWAGAEPYLRFAHHVILENEGAFLVDADPTENTEPGAAKAKSISLCTTNSVIDVRIPAKVLKDAMIRYAGRSTFRGNDIEGQFTKLMNVLGGTVARCRPSHPGGGSTTTCAVFEDTAQIEATFLKHCGVWGDDAIAEIDRRSFLGSSKPRLSPATLVQVAAFMAAQAEGVRTITLH